MYVPHPPNLICLPLYFCVFKWILNYGSHNSSYESCKHCPPFKTSSHRYLSRKQRVFLPFCVECLKNGKLNRCDQTVAKEWWDKPPIEANHTLFLKYRPTCLECANGLAHLVALRLHLGLYCIKGMSCNLCNTTVKYSCQARDKPLPNPASSFFVVCHFMFNL